MAQEETPPEDLADRGTIMDDDAQGAAVPMPDSIGSYDIKGVIGAGAMGVVYLARQSNPERDVAIKVMKSGVVSRKAMRRFEFEAQTLGRLQHPAIAQVYEANTWDDGDGARPFFSMEYVTNAKELGDFVQDNQLDTRARLELFCAACEGVEYGHRRGVIHRDLKPGNILVDADGRPKIIDFGVARSTDADAVSATLATEAGQLIGTLQYMSPEQVELDPAELDTRSDVYALGVILYQLLVDRLPYDLTGTSLTKAGELIKEVQPTRLASMNASLSGDLETICLKALEKDRDQRYQSVGELSEDLRRFLADEPILARPPTSVEQFRRFIRKNKAAAVAGAVVAFACVAATSISVLFAIEAGKQRDTAHEATEEAKASTQRAEQQAWFGNIHAASAALTQNDVGSAALRLSDARQVIGNSPIETLPFEWQYLNARTSDAQLVLKGHTRWVTDAIFIPATSKLASSSLDGTLRIWDATTGECDQIIAQAPYGFISIACTPDGRYLLSSDTSKALTGFDLQSAPAPFEQFTISLPGTPTYTVGSPRDSVVACAIGGDIVCVAVPSGETTAVMKGHNGLIFRATYSADGTQLATTSADGPICLWDAHSGELTRQLTLDTACRDVALSPDGRWIAGGGVDGSIRLWDRESGALQRTLLGSAGPVYAISFTPDSQSIISGGSDHTIRIWDTATGAAQDTLRGHQNLVLNIDVNADGTRVASSGNEHDILLWSTQPSAALNTVLLADARMPPADLSFSPEGNHLSGITMTSQQVQRWNATTHRGVASLGDGDSPIRAVAYSPNGQHMAVATRKTLQIFDTQTDTLMNSWELTTSAVTGLAFSHDGQRVAATSTADGGFVWQVVSGEQVHHGKHDGQRLGTLRPDESTGGFQCLSGQLPGTVTICIDSSDAQHPHTVTFSPSSPTAATVIPWATFSADGTQLAWAQSDGVDIVDVATGTIEQTLPTPEVKVRSMAFSPDGHQLLCGHFKGALEVWDLDAGSIKATMIGHDSTITAVTFLPNGNSVVSGSVDNTIRVWDATTGELVQTNEAHTSTVVSLACSRDGTLLASGGRDKTIRLWKVNTETGELQFLRQFTGHAGSIEDLAFSSDGGTLASVSSKTARLWDVHDGTQKQVLHGVGKMARVCFADNDAVLFSVEAGNVIRRWDCATGACLESSPAVEQIAGCVAYVPERNTVIRAAVDRRWMLQIRELVSNEVVSTLDHGSTDTLQMLLYPAAHPFSPSGDRIALKGANAAIICDVDTGARLATMDLSEATVRDVAFDPDGRRLATVDSSAALRLWDVATGQGVLILKDGGSELWAVGWSPCGSQIVSANREGIVRFWSTWPRSQLVKNTK